MTLGPTGTGLRGDRVCRPNRSVIFMRATLFLLALQMVGTLTPLVLFPGEVFTHVPYAPTLEGQYIIKNAVLISAAIVLGATVRGGGLVAEQGQTVASS